MPYLLLISSFLFAFNVSQALASNVAAGAKKMVTTPPVSGTSTSKKMLAQTSATSGVATKMAANPTKPLIPQPTSAISPAAQKPASQQPTSLLLPVPSHFEGPQYVIFGKDNCIYCKKSKALLDQVEGPNSYRYVNVVREAPPTGEVITWDTLRLISNRGNSVPQIFDGRHIGGYTELKKNLGLIELNPQALSQQLMMQKALASQQTATKPAQQALKTATP